MALGPARSPQTTLPDPRVSHGPSSSHQTTLPDPRVPMAFQGHLRLICPSLGWPGPCKVTSEYLTLP